MASQLAYYHTKGDVGVLAPRGWYCYGGIGANGGGLTITPTPVKKADLFKNPTGSVIKTIGLEGDNYGAAEDAADIIAREFPSHRQSVLDMIKERINEEDLTNHFHFGPYPKDKTIYRNDQLTEYSTPAHSEGFGSEEMGLDKNDNSIDGAILLDPAAPRRTTMMMVAVRLPPDMSDLKPSIIHQFEKECSDPKSNKPIKSH